MRTSVRWWTGAVFLAALLLPPGRAGQQSPKAGDQGSPPQGTPAQKRQSVNNLKQIALAFHYYHDAHKRFPAATFMPQELQAPLGITRPLTQEQLAKAIKEAKRPLPLFSWRVEVLPYLEQGELYKEFHRHEPWDSEHNKKLIPKMPAVYAPATGKQEPGLTYYQVFVGKVAPFNGTTALGIRDFTDGTSNTFLVVEASEAVPWTKPQDLAYDATKALPKLGGLFKDGFHAALADGSVHFIPRKTPEKTIRALITPRGGEAVGVP
jgi:hypothetical protein